MKCALFFRCCPAIPEKCFISAEAVDWVCGRIEGVNSVEVALNLLQRLVDEGYIRHVTASSKFDKFLFGMFLYYVVGSETLTTTQSAGMGGLVKGRRKRFEPSLSFEI